LTGDEVIQVTPNLCWGGGAKFLSGGNLTDILSLKCPAKTDLELTKVVTAKANFRVPTAAKSSPIADFSQP